MTTLLQKAIAQVQTLPLTEQNEAAEGLMHYAHFLMNRTAYGLTPEQIKGVKEAQAAMRRGEFASKKSILTIRRRVGI